VEIDLPDPGGDDASADERTAMPPAAATGSRRSGDGAGPA